MSHGGTPKPPATPATPAPPPALTALDDLHISEPLCAVFRRTLKKVGLKYTPERARILDGVLSMGDLFQAEQLMERLRADAQSRGSGRDLKVSKATVYRTIKLLADAGIIQQVLFDSEQAHYQLAYGRRAAGLLVNTDTHEARHVDVPELEALCQRICKDAGVTPRGYRLVIYAGA